MRVEPRDQCVIGVDIVLALEPRRRERVGNFGEGLRHPGIATRPRRSGARRGFFEGAAHLEQSVDVAGIDVGDHCHARRLLRDEAVGSEPREGLAKRRATHAEAHRLIDLAEHGAGREHTALNLFEQHAVGAITLAHSTPSASVYTNPFARSATRWISPQRIHTGDSAPIRQPRSSLKNVKEHDTGVESAPSVRIADTPGGAALHAGALDAAELAALRRRAYSADADIFTDADALARLQLLEDRLQQAQDADPDAPPTDGGHGDPHRISSGVTPRRPRRRIVAGITASIVAIGIVAGWWAQQEPTSEPEPAAIPSFAPIAGAPTGDPSEVEGRVGASSAEDFTSFLDDLRDDLLARADLQGPAGRLIRAELAPYGGSNGWSSWAGPTIDNQICLVVSDGGIPIVRCDTPENVANGAVSTIVTAGEADSRGDAGFAPGTKMRIILLPGAVATEPYTGD